MSVVEVDSRAINSDARAVAFRVVHLGNDVVRIEALEIVALGDAEASAELPGVERLSYPLSCAQDDMMREALRLVCMGEALSSVSIFDGYCQSIAPGVVAYTVWLTG